MPLLFISYKRGTAGIDELMTRLKQADYAIWFDRVDIKGGRKDWQAEIDRGINDSDALILCLTAEAARSPYVQYEVALALENERKLQRTYQAAGHKGEIVRIFPVLLEKPEDGDVSGWLTEAGLESRRQCIDMTMTDSAALEKAYQALLNALSSENIIPSRCDQLNLQRHTRTSMQFSRYLRAMVDELGHLSLTKTINPDFESGELYLRDIYVPPPTEFKVVMDVQGYDIQRWWLHRNSALEDGIHTGLIDDAFVAQLDNDYELIEQQITLQSASSHNWNRSQIQILIEERREQLYHQQNQDRHRRFARLDEAWEVHTLSAHQVVSGFRRVILTGDAGSGKTLFARYLASTLAEELNSPPEQSAIQDWQHRCLTPIYIEMYPLAQFLDAATWDAQGLFAYIKTHVLSADLKDFADELHNQLTGGGTLLIFDGLETILTGSEPAQRQRHQQLDLLFTSISLAFENARLLILSRPEPLAKWHMDKFMIVSLAPFMTGHRQALAHRLFATLYRKESEQETRTRAANLIEQLENYSIELAGNPRFITLLATAGEVQYGRLFETVVNLLLEMWTQSKTGMVSLRDVLHSETSAEAKLKLIENLLSPLAYDSLRDQAAPLPGTTGPNVEHPYYTYVFKLAAAEGAMAEEVNTYLRANSGVLVEQNGLRFAHEGFRQYLAAEYIKRQSAAEDGGDDPNTFLRDLIEDDPYRWEKAARIVGDLIDDPFELVALLDALVDDEPPQQAHPNDRRYFSVWLAARIAVDQQLTPEKVHRSQRRYLSDKLDELKSWLKLLVSTPLAPSVPSIPGAVDMVRRAEAGRLLSRLGDDRPGVGTIDGLPDFDLIDIPGGQYTIGMERVTDRDEQEPPSNPNISPRRTLTVDPFRIARHPVTVMQYACFVNDDGYNQRKFWDEESWLWLSGQQHPMLVWENPQWHIDNHPVVGVSWYEANAYCRWLSERTGLPYRLLTGAEWEIAATGNTSNVYPFEGDFDHLKANSRLTDIERTSAVGLFPDGQSPFGVLDMAGNVYEWCSDVHPDDTHQTKLYEMRRLLRGGSWRSYPGFLKNVARYWDYPSQINTYWGFRVACSAQSAPSTDR